MSVERLRSVRRGTGLLRCFLYGMAIVLCLGWPAPLRAAETPESLFAATQRAATSGDAEAMMLLGHLYARGTGVAKDAGQAIKWYSLAAGRGHAEAAAARDRLLAETGRVSPLPIITAYEEPPPAPAPSSRAGAQSSPPFEIVPYSPDGPPPLPVAAPVAVPSSDPPRRVESESAPVRRAVARPQQPVSPRAARNAPVAKSPRVSRPLPAKPSRQVVAKAEQASPAPTRGRRSAQPAPGAAEQATGKEAAAAPEKPEIDLAQLWAREGQEGVMAPKAVPPLLTPPALPAVDAADAAGAKEAEAAGKALQGNQPRESLERYRKAVLLAVAAGKSDLAGAYAQEITNILNLPPAWAEEALNQASAVPQEKAGAAVMWSKAREGALEAAGKGDFEGAIRLGKQALDLARENLGARHAASFMTARELGRVYAMAGKPAEAEPLLRQAADDARAILGGNHPETVNADKALAEFLESRLKFADAQEIHKKSRPAIAGKLGADHPLALDNEMALARVQVNLSQADEAIRQLTATCPRVAATHGHHHPETARCLEQYATARMAREAFPEALAAYEQEAAILAGMTPDGDPARFPARIGMAEANRRMGQAQKAREILDALLGEAARGQAGKDPALLEARAGLVRALTDLGEFQAAETTANALLKTMQESLGAEHPSTVALRADLAGIHQKLGRLAEAEKELKEILEQYRKAFGEAHPTAITTMNNLGQVLEEAGLYDEAEPLLRQSLTLAQKHLGSAQPLTLTTMNNLALLHESQGNFDKAEPLYHNAIDLSRKRLGERHPDTVAVINNLAYLQLLRQDYAKAEPLFKKIAEIWRKHLGDKHQRTLKAMNNLARVTHHLGRHKEAEALFVKTLDLRRQALGERHMDVMRSMHDLALLYRDMGRMKESEELLRKTRSLDEEVLGPLHPYTFETMNTMASVLEKGKNPEALSVRKEIFARRTAFFDRMLWSTGENAREGYIRLHQPEYDDHLAHLARLDGSTGGREVLEAALQRKGILLKIASEIRQVVQLGKDPKLTVIGERLTATRKQLAALTLSGPTQESGEKHLEVIHGLEQEVDRLQQELGQASKRFQRTSGNVSVAELEKHLPEKAALVDFLVFRDGQKTKLLAGILKKEQGQPHFDLVVYPDMEAIQKAVTDYRGMIQDEEAEEEAMKKMGRAVYDLVWAPVKQAIGGREQVYVVPDGLLNILPFPALVDPEDVYLARGTDLHMLTSSRDLLPSGQPEATGNYLIMAGPDYNSDKVSSAQTQALKEAEGRRSADFKQGLRAFSSGMRGLHFDPLPGAEKEGKLIAGQASDKKKLNTILIRNEAQEAALQSLAAPPEIVHIATHGFFLKPDDSLRKRLLKLARGGDLKLPPPGDNPLLRSGLAFAGINANAKFLGELDTGNDGVLTALEVLGLDLTGTRLAVLSACETGLGEVHEGEGVYGLRRAFQEAGAQAVISSLWEVSDAGTQALMTNLYARLGDGMTPHQALREAQLDLLESEEWKHPYIWSAFMMVGQ
ncbi:MAG: tetratricopeptide repeat protein [Magnetococcales bacterium]|nr:tetratricopeptide repeat protein [Magnetococcales bacterium]